MGRSREIAVVTRLVQQHRLVTLTGAGGVGKTRLALHVAAGLVDRFADGATLVPLAAVSDPTLVSTNIAQLLGLQYQGGGGTTVEWQLQEALHNKRLLLILDNFEHLPDAAPQVVQLLSACSHVTALVTSRAALHVSGEHVFPLLPLPVPELDQPMTPETLSQYAAVRLFLDRAEAARPDFALTTETASEVVAICHRLDGLPLAIELAAARVRVLSVQAILRRLEQRLDVLVDGPVDAPERHRTLRAAIDWSYELLSSHQQTLFRRLGAFAGGCTLAAAESVCVAGNDLPKPDASRPDISGDLFSLVEHGLVHTQPRPDGEPRFWLLETLREYALERLESRGEAQATRQRHADYFTALAAHLGAAERIAGPQGALNAARLGDELENVREALGWSLGTDHPSVVLRLTEAMRDFWDLRGYHAEARRWLNNALALPQAKASTRVRASLLIAAGNHADRLGHYDAGRTQLKEALAIARDLSDAQLVVNALHHLGMIAGHQGDYETARPLHEEALVCARSAELRHLEGQALGQLAWEACGVAEFSRARAYAVEALSIARQLRSTHLTTFALTMLGYAEHWRGQQAVARIALEEALSLARQLGLRRMIGDATEGLARIAAAEGRWAEARRLLIEVLPVRQGVGSPLRAVSSLESLASVAAHAGQWVYALQLAGAADAQRDRLGVRPYFGWQCERLRASLDPAWRVLGRVEADRVWAAGHAMSLDQAIALALSAGELDVECDAVQTVECASHSTHVSGVRAGSLTRREAEVLRLIAAGKSNREIAEALVLSVRTVERHITNLYAKIDARGRAGAAVYALSHTQA